MSVVMFRGYDERIYSHSDIECAFYLVTGKKHEYSFRIDGKTNHGEYCRFLNGLFGTSISEWFVPTVDSLIESGHRVLAIKLYRDENGCTLKEAHDYVDKRIKDELTKDII